MGGLVGGLGQHALEVDDAKLDDQEKVELHRLIAAATASPAPAAASKQLRDAQTYEILIEDEGTSAALEATDGSMPQAFVELRDWLRAR